MPPTPATSASPAGGWPDQLRLLVEAQTDYAMFLLDPGGHITTWNRGAERVKGYQADEIIGRHFSTFYTPEDIARNHPANELAIAMREGRYEEEGWRVRKDGTRFWANVVITLLRDADGQIVGFGKVTRDLTERRAAEEELRLAAERLAHAEQVARAEADRMRMRAAAVEEVGRAIVASSDLEQIVQIATDAATELTRAAFGAFFYNVLNERGESYMLYTISGVPREAFSRFPMPRNTEVFEPTFTGAGVVRSGDITRDPRYGRMAPHHGMPAGHLPVRSYLAVPVTTTDGEVAGGLFFGHPDPAVFDRDAEDAAVSVAASAAVALVNARLLEAARRETVARQVALEERDAVARVLQESLLPPALPRIPGLELGSAYQAGTELVGGDFYDVFALGEDRWGVVLGDVCGSGPQAASHTALMRHSVRTAAMFDADPVHVLQAVNTVLMRSEDDRFTTAVFARLGRTPAGGIEACIASAGHPPALVCRADGSTAESRAWGTLLGIVDEIELGPDEVTLGPGDLLVLYTDGLVEARVGGRLFGPERVRDTVAELRDHAPSDIATTLVRRAQEFAGAPVSDDIAVVVLRVATAEDVV